MFDKAVTGTAVRYGLTGGIVSAAYIILLAVLGLENPYASVPELSSTLLFVPAFVFLATRYHKQYIDSEIGFAKAFRVGLSTAVLLALTTAVLMFLFSITIGAEMIEQYITLEQENMRLAQDENIKTMGEANFQYAYQKVRELTAFSLAQRTFVYRFLLGAFISVVSGVFFRK